MQGWCGYVGCCPSLDLMGKAAAAAGAGGRVEGQLGGCGSVARHFLRCQGSNCMACSDVILAVWAWPHEAMGRGIVCARREMLQA